MELSGVLDTGENAVKPRSAGRAKDHQFGHADLDSSGDARVRMLRTVIPIQGNWHPTLPRKSR